MNPRVIGVKPLEDYRLELLFTNQERKLFDVKPYLSIGIFQELRDTSVFNGIRAFNGSIVWPNDLDLDPDTLYLDSQSIS
ncbi:MULTISPECIES: DUF2442 domain-containing protein [Spirosoma]|uniref:DUF2442 domain-containing protein n=1 Tax=Spirosoma TaxID=107 RepID=UPI00095B300B|nr:MULTISPECIES: DUF2442 domain-containing protein [Spirosoma]MBN8821155.1 DUF2442 domain-containing protein [Spirosoma sp.]OJW79213.1 MAG: hypothetical protein BGO59_11750 [Spirosoma sp. 48-14]